MTHEERNNLIAIVTSLLINGWLGWRVWTLYQAGEFAGPDALMLWARTVLWVIPASVVLTIILTIVFTILFAIATRDENPDFTVDERDKNFGRRGMIAAMVVASGGFLLAVGLLALGWTAFAAFNILYAGFALASLAGNVVTLGSYRRGY